MLSLRSAYILFIYTYFAIVTALINKNYSDNYNIINDKRNLGLDLADLFNDINSKKNHMNEIIKNSMQKAYPKILQCLMNSNTTSSQFEKLLSNKKTTLDVLDHYEKLLELTKSMRSAPKHYQAGYNGPWIENIFIEHFLEKPLSYFNGMIPLFVQFVDLHVNDFRTKVRPLPTHKETIDLLLENLRDDVIYIAVSQDDSGLTSKLCTSKPNILVLSSGGYGHIPIPLIKGELKLAPHRSFKRYRYDAGFYGATWSHPIRQTLMAEVADELKRRNVSVLIGNGNIAVMTDITKVNFAPRGFGRSSYRLSEIIQVGRIPMYMYSDYNWAPYQGTNISIENFGFVIKNGTEAVTNIVNKIQNITEDDYNDKIMKLLKAREYYTYSGVIKQMEKFFSDPFGINGGELRCTRMPETEN